MIIHKSVAKKITVITAIFNNFDLLREPKVINSDVEYICITDNPNLHSNTWKIIVNPDSIKKDWSPRKKTYYIRYHLFEFADSEYCFWIDASIELNKINFQNYVDKNNDFVLFLDRPVKTYFDSYYRIITNATGCQYLYNVLLGYINMLNLLYTKFNDIPDIKALSCCIIGCKNTEHVKNKLSEIYNTLLKFVRCENSNIPNEYKNVFFKDISFFDEPIAGIILHSESIFRLDFYQMMQNDEFTIYHHNTYDIRFKK
jgi:hypothetical protein